MIATNISAGLPSTSISSSRLRRRCKISAAFLASSSRLLSCNIIAVHSLITTSTNEVYVFAFVYISCKQGNFLSKSKTKGK